MASLNDIRSVIQEIIKYEPLTPANFAESLRQLGGRAVPRATKSMPPRAPKSKAPPPGESASKPKSKAKEKPAG